MLDWNEEIPTFSSNIGKTGINMELPSVMMRGIEVKLAMHQKLTEFVFFFITTPRLHVIYSYRYDFLASSYYAFDIFLFSAIEYV